MNLLEKLLDIQVHVDAFVKDTTVESGKSSHKAVGSTQVLSIIRPLMNEHKLLLIPSVTNANVLTGSTASGTVRYFTEMYFLMTWVDVESGERETVPWYGQGVDLAGEKGVGKANTYAEKYFLMKFFHVPTEEDDPDSSARGKNGQLLQKGTQAEKETTEYCRKASVQILDEICGDDEARKSNAVKLYTQNTEHGFAGFDNVDAVPDTQINILYGKLKAAYKTKFKRTYTYKADD